MMTRHPSRLSFEPLWGDLVITVTTVLFGLVVRSSSIVPHHERGRAEAKAWSVHLGPRQVRSSSAVRSAVGRHHALAGFLPTIGMLDKVAPDARAFAKDLAARARRRSDRRRVRLSVRPGLPRRPGRCGAGR